MRSRIVAVRCFAEQSKGAWEAHCVELGLAARGDSLEAVKRELDRMIHETIDDQLLKRRRSAREAAMSALGPLALRARYWGLYLAGRLGWRTDALRSAPQPYRPGTVPRLAR